MKKILLILSLAICTSLTGQSTIGINETYIGAYGLQHELHIASHLADKFQISLKMGTNFKKYSSYKMGLRYSLFNIKSTKFNLGCDVGHLQYTFDNEVKKQGYRTFELNTGVQYDISKNLNGVFEIGIMNKEFSSDPTPVILRLGLGYKI
jgi:hypothetical protein